MTMSALNTIANATAANATPVHANFQTIATYVDDSLLNKDGSIAMDATADLVLGRDPSSALHATTKQYVDAAIPALSWFRRDTDVTTTVDWRPETELDPDDGWHPGTGGFTFTCPVSGVFAITFEMELSAEGNPDGSGVMATFHVADGAAIGVQSLFDVKDNQYTDDNTILSNGGVFRIRANQTFRVRLNPNGATIANATLFIVKLAEI